MRHAVLFVIVALCQAAPGDEPPAYREITLRPPEWRLFVPVGVGPREAKVDLLVHFHGHPPTVMRNVAQAGVDAVVVTVNYPGLSSVYRRPFSDPALFGSLLEAARGALQRDAQFAGLSEFDSIAVSSFSAGFGAVRELLRQPHKDRINGVLAADSMYASTAADGTPEDTQMAPYIAYAERAARGEVAFVLTHTEVPTPGYESTRETADELLERLDLAPTTVDLRGRGPLRFTRRAERGRFELWGTPGTTGEEHMAHLRHMSQWLGSLPLRASSHRAGADAASR